MALYLATPLRKHRRAWKWFRKEFLRAGKKHIPGSGDKKTYGAFLRSCRRFASEATVPEGRVPASKFFLMEEGGTKILGIIDIRHRLNDYLLNNPGGHIGYAVAPSERRTGYGTRQLRLALEICREMGLDRVLVTCNKANAASARVIQKNGGVLEDERPDKDGLVFQRYWIEL